MPNYLAIYEICYSKPDPEGLYTIPEHAKREYRFEAKDDSEAFKLARREVDQIRNIFSLTKSAKLSEVLEIRNIPLIKNVGPNPWDSIELLDPEVLDITDKNTK